MMALPDKDKIHFLKSVIREIARLYDARSGYHEASIAMYRAATTALEIIAMEENNSKPVEPLTADEISLLRAWLKRPRDWSA
jgi:hypothetical protein